MTTTGFEPQETFAPKKEPRGRVTTNVETLTPHDAEALLARNGQNRHVRETRVNTYARAMAQGAWALNGESIKVSRTNRLLDGQHRLKAVVETGAPLTTVVVRGLDDSIQETIDIGDKRTLGDTLRLRGEKNANNLAAALSTAYRIDKGTMNQSQWWPTNHELLLFLDEHPDIRDSHSANYRALGSPMRYPPSQAWALDWLFRRVADGETVDSFWDRLFVGVGLEAGDPVLALRNFLIKDNIETRRRSPVMYRIALTIKAWNLSVARKQVTTVNWAPGEGFPRIERP